MAKKAKVIIETDVTENIESNVPKRLSALPLRDAVIFPYMIFPILVGRNSTLKAVAHAMEKDKLIFVSAQKNPQEEEPTTDDIYTYGCVARILQVLKLPNNVLKILIEGLYHAKIKRKIKNPEFLEVLVEQVHEVYDAEDKELLATSRHAGDMFKDYIKRESNLPPDVALAFDAISDLLQKLYYAAANIRTKLDRKQSILEQTNIKKQYFELTSILTYELELLQIESEIENKVQNSIQKNQKKYYIQEQIRALQQELGDDEEYTPELANIKEAIEKAELPEHAQIKAKEEFEKLKKTPSMSPEYSVNRTYLEMLTALPWTQKSQDILDLRHVKTILDEDHYDMVKPKDRILEFIAALNLAGSLKKQILCFVGPPGVGKTSLARSIARALGRKFIRFSLGGIRDEAEIRGHRRTYVGSMPGKIIQSMKKAGVINPVILLDEIDKMSADFRGDPSSALLEALDPEQNVSFNDHYLEVDYDLSNVFFITTANVKYDIPLPLLDRMEIIDLAGYLETEKAQIAKRHIIPKVIKEYGFEKFKIEFKDEAILKIIREYTRESGVRNLEREITSIYRKLAKELVEEFDSKRGEDDERKVLVKDDKNFNRTIAKRKYVIDENKVEEFLKSPKFKDKKDDLDDKIGVASGLAWTSVGGDIMPIEASIMPGNEKLTLTGKLGDVMKESAMAALSYIRSNWAKLNVPENFNKRKEIHIHVPEGAIPKDGPSAGITMTLALLSAACEKPLRGDVCMTGEVTLRGNVLAIGGLREKLLAARTSGMKLALVPDANRRDVADIDPEILDGLEVVFVKNIEEALPYVFRPEKEKTTIRVKI